MGANEKSVRRDRRQSASKRTTVGGRIHSEIIRSGCHRRVCRARAPIVDANDQPIGPIRDGDSIIFFNFRSDRARQLTRALALNDFDGFERVVHPQISMTTMTQYDRTFTFPVAFPPQSLTRIVRGSDDRTASDESARRGNRKISRTSATSSIAASRSHTRERIAFWCLRRRCRPTTYSRK